MKHAPIGTKFMPYPEEVRTANATFSSRLPRPDWDASRLQRALTARDLRRAAAWDRAIGYLCAACLVGLGVAGALGAL